MQIYVHGLGQTPDSWNNVVSQLNAAEDSICPSLAELIRGKEATYQNLYAAFSALCDETGEPVNICGLSLGGVLALNYAIDHPDKVESMILIAAQYKMPKKLLKFQNVIFRLMPKSMFLQMGFGKNDFFKLCKTMMELDFSKSLQKVSCPVLVICGSKDNANKNASKELANRLPNSVYHELCGTGHEVNAEAPENLAKAIRSFFKGLRDEKSLNWRNTHPK